MNEEDQKIAKNAPKKQLQVKQKCVPFLKMEKQEQEELMLKWLFPKIENFGNSIDYQLVESLEVNGLPDCFADKSIDVKLIKDYFDTKTFNKLKKLVVTKKKDAIFHCVICEDLVFETDDAIICEICYFWYHYSCINLKSVPRGSWFCNRH